MASKYSYHVDVRYDLSHSGSEATSEVKTRTVIAGSIDEAVAATLADCATWGPEYSNFVAESCAKTGVIDVVA